MKGLSFGANLAWQIAAGEAAAANHQFIDKEHILIGIFSLEKLLMFNVEKSGELTAVPTAKSWRNI